MRASLHRRRANLSLPPEHQRFPRSVVLFLVVASITVAVAAARARVDEPAVAPAPAVVVTARADAPDIDATSEQTRALIDERLHVHLKKLQALR